MPSASEFTDSTKLKTTDQLVEQFDSFPKSGAATADELQFYADLPNQLQHLNEYDRDQLLRPMFNGNRYFLKRALELSNTLANDYFTPIFNVVGANIREALLESTTQIQQLIASYRGDIPEGQPFLTPASMRLALITPAQELTISYPTIGFSTEQDHRVAFSLLKPEQRESFIKKFPVFALHEVVSLTAEQLESCFTQMQRKSETCYLVEWEKKQLLAAIEECAADSKAKHLYRTITRFLMNFGLAAFSSEQLFDSYEKVSKLALKSNPAAFEIIFDGFPIDIIMRKIKPVSDLSVDYESLNQHVEFFITRLKKALSELQPDSASSGRFARVLLGKYLEIISKLPAEFFTAKQGLHLIDQKISGNLVDVLKTCFALQPQQSRVITIFDKFELSSLWSAVRDSEFRDQVMAQEEQYGTSQSRLKAAAHAIDSPHYPAWLNQFPEIALYGVAARTARQHGYKKLDGDAAKPIDHVLAVMKNLTKSRMGLLLSFHWGREGLSEARSLVQKLEALKQSNPADLQKIHELLNESATVMLTYAAKHHRNPDKISFIRRLAHCQQYIDQRIGSPASAADRAPEQTATAPSA